MFGVFINLGLLYWKRHAHPLNLVLLSTFTLLEAFTLGILCAYIDNAVVLQALYVRLIRHRLGVLKIVMQVDYLGSFLGLDCFHFPIEGVLNAKPYTSPPDNIQYDFSGMGPWLFGGLIALCKHPFLLTRHFYSNGHTVIGMTGIVGIFIPFSRTIDLLYAIGGTILFSGYIVYDTYLINRRLSPDEYIMAAISLYLECVSDFQLSSHPTNPRSLSFVIALSISVSFLAAFPPSRCSNSSLYLVLSILRLLNNLQSDR